jgi:hypothetical protein
MPGRRRTEKMKFHDYDWYDDCKHLYKDPYAKIEKKIRYLEEKAMSYNPHYQTAISSQTVIYPNQWIVQTACTQTVTYPNYVPASALSSYFTNFFYTMSDVAPETEEQRLEREQRQRDEKAKDDARCKRARETLLSVLNQTQREQLEKTQHFELQVNDRLYRIRPGFRVERLDPKTKKAVAQFCIHPALEHNLPSDDVALSQKLLLEANEIEFLRIANEIKAEITPVEAAA